MTIGGAGSNWSDYPIHDPEIFRRMIADVLSNLSTGEMRGYINVIVLTPPHPVNNITYLVVGCRGGSLRMVVSLREKGVGEKSTVLFREPASKDAYYARFVSFFEDRVLNLPGWREPEQAKRVDWFDESVCQGRAGG